jgi:hypothetical protein
VLTQESFAHPLGTSDCSHIANVERGRDRLGLPRRRLLHFAETERLVA